MAAPPGQSPELSTKKNPVPQQPAKLMDMKGMGELM
jgi:hypothetical protein